MALLISLKIYLTVHNRPNPINSPVKVGVSYFIVYKYDIHRDKLSYNVSFSLNFLNTYKAGLSYIKAVASLLSYEQLIGFKNLPGFSLDVNQSSIINFNLSNNDIDFQNYPSNNIIDLYLLLKLNISSHLPSKSSNYSINLGCNILSSQPPEGHVLLGKGCKVV